MKLYYHNLSGHSHRTRLFLGLLGADYEPVFVDLMKGEHKTESFLRINPFGQVPALVDGDTSIGDSNAILVYLAKKTGRAVGEFAGAQPTIADVALYSYISAAPEGNVDTSDYPSVLAWLDRVEALPGFVPFDKTAVGLVLA